MLPQILPLAALAATVSAHGLILSPTPRTPGDASIAACGKSVSDNVKNDETSHVEGLPELAAADPDYKADECNVWLCKGLQYADNAANLLDAKSLPIVESSPISKKMQSYDTLST